MLINIKKTKSMLVVGKRIRKRLPIDMPILDINLNETKIEQVPNYKLLGVNIRCFDVISINFNGRKVYEDEIFARQDTSQFFLGESKDHKSV